MDEQIVVDVSKAKYRTTEMASRVADRSMQLGRPVTREHSRRLSARA